MKKLLGNFLVKTGFFLTSLGFSFYETMNCKDECGEVSKEDKDFAYITEKTAKRFKFTGSCFPVNNYKPHPAANREYYVVALRNPHDEEKTDVYMFTEKELINAQNRADKNTEDIPDDIADYDLRIERTED